MQKTKNMSTKFKIPIIISSKMKKDYEKGINILKKHLFNNNLCTIYYSIVSQDKWIFGVSWLLSKYGVCEVFWENVIKQEYINNITECETIEDIFYDCYLFEWDRTKEGNEFWYSVSDDIISEYRIRCGTQYLSKEDEENNNINF